MSGDTADPTHVYWDLENRKGLWARGEAMSVPPTAKELIRGIRHAEEDWDAVIDGETLAERVEAVLALLKKYRTIPADLIERILDGGKP